MNNKFVRNEAKILIYGERRNYYVTDCNNQEQIDNAIRMFGEPYMFMNGFANWKEMAVAKHCYQDMFSAMPQCFQPATRPTAEQLDWFVWKQLDDEHYWNQEKVMHAFHTADELLEGNKALDAMIENLRRERLI